MPAKPPMDIHPSAGVRTDHPAPAALSAEEMHWATCGLAHQPAGFFGG